MAQKFKTVGFIGIGTMGKGMVLNLAKNKFSVLAYNRSEEKLKEVIGNNVKAASSITEIAKADIIFTCVSNDAAIQEVYDELIPELSKGKVLVDSSTISVDLTQKIAQVCKKQGVKFLDAPVTGGKTGAENGTLVFMVGGKKELFNEVVPVLKAMGKVQVYCGEAGFGQRAKLALNLTQALILQSTLEGIILAMKNGVPFEAIEEIFNNSGAKSGVGTAKLAAIKQRNFEPSFKHSLMHKDVGLAQKEMDKLNLHFPLSSQMLGVFESSKDYKDEDFAAIVKQLEKKAKVVIKNSNQQQKPPRRVSGR